MTLGGRKIDEHDRSSFFATFFNDKIKSITDNTIVDNQVYNGDRKLEAQNLDFMSMAEVELAIKSIKIKNSEGFDRIPQRVLIEGMAHLLNPLCKLFNFIYCSKTIPDQWRLSKIVPVHKKGSKSEIENYRPVANLCSASKIFERLILQQDQSIGKTQ